VRYQPEPTSDSEGNDAKTVQESDSGAIATVGIPPQHAYDRRGVPSVRYRLAALLMAAVVTDTNFRPFRPKQVAERGAKGQKRRA
jgi:hypothetical protein